MIPTLARLEELRALCDAATSGPWVRDDWPNPGMQVIAHGNRSEERRVGKECRL